MPGRTRFIDTESAAPMAIGTASITGSYELTKIIVLLDVPKESQDDLLAKTVDESLALWH